MILNFMNKMIITIIQTDSYKLGLCDNEKCYITIMMIIITIIAIIFLDDINSFWCISNFKNTKSIAQTLSKIRAYLHSKEVRQSSSCLYLSGVLLNLVKMAL